MEEGKRPRERELVLAPNEYAYVLDTTKGHVNCYVGPHKTSLAQTDQPVVFDERTKRFEATAELAKTVQLFATAPANWYLVLKNPAKDGSHPKPGIASTAVDLQVGRKIVVAGPASFALWPGQMARVLEGHRLASNQYVVVRVYDPEAAGQGTVGEERIVTGTDASFFVPPTGMEVVADDDGRFVRDAVTLQRLEYCVLVGEDGKKRFVRGEAVVFPAPHQRFFERGGRRVFKAIELSEITGLYVKVIAPYVDEDGVEHVEGEELFLTGASKIYFPREEHAIIRYGGAGDGEELHQAIAVPAGEGRYVLNRLTGAVSLVVGPRMLLPDPRREVLARRVLADREARLFYPGNDEAAAVNEALRRGATRGVAATTAKQGGRAPAVPAPPPSIATAAAAAKARGDEDGGLEADAFSRARTFAPPRTLTLDGKYDGAVAVRVWAGYAVQVVDKAGARRVVQGPATVLLAWDETLEALSLSTGTPKSADDPLATVYLQVHGNQVSDEIDVVTSDLVEARVKVKYRVSFEGDDPARWFSVSDYVKLLCDHASSIVKAACRKRSVRALKETVADVVRDALLGEKPATGDRRGLAFAENRMRAYDVEVLDLQVLDARVAELLADAQLAAVRGAVAVAAKEAALAEQRQVAEIERALLHEQHALEQERLRITAALQELRRAADLADVAAEGEMQRARLDAAAAAHAARVKERGELQALDVALLQARVDGAVRQAQAYAPDLVAAVNRLSDAQLLSSLAENFGELAAVEGKGLVETARKFLDFVPHASMPVLRGKAT